MVTQIIQFIQTSIELGKCRHCGCMRESLQEIKERLEESNDPQFYPLFTTASLAYDKLEDVQYS